MKLSLQSFPRHLVLAADLLLCLVSFVLAYLLRFNFEIGNHIFKSVPIMLPGVLALKLLAFWYFKTYAGILKFTSTEDLKKLFAAISLTSLLLLAAQLVTNKIFGNQNFIPISVILIDYVASLSMLAFLRIAVKTMHYEWNHKDSRKVQVAIFGSGEIARITHNTLLDDAGIHYRVIAFLDDVPKRAGSYLNGVRIEKTTENLTEQLRNLQADLLVLADHDFPEGRKKQVVDACLSVGIQVLVVPPVYKWINGELSFRQIREIQIEDILGREPIQLDKQLVQEEIHNKVVLVSGAAGSIGSELVRQIIPFKPKLLILLDQAESALYELELELMELYVKVNFEVVLGDIRNLERMEEVFRNFKPELVFHAAAYKHVPVIEENPSEAVPTNITGTRILADLSVKYKVRKFVYLSTDKAVNPTSVMGASKRIGEMYTQALNHYLRDSGENQTRFITTRFGNVLGSTGSVIPRFRKQIEAGGPVTVTHPEISRYFMTIPEACQLVLDAAAMGKGGEIYLFDMGQSIKIVELAKKMIKLSGLVLGKDIQLVFTGLRPGEKLEEELFHAHENFHPTHHPKIRIARVEPHDYQELSQQVTELDQLFTKQNNTNIIIKMKSMLPEYISKNSVYEKLNVRK